MTTNETPGKTPSRTAPSVDPAAKYGVPEKLIDDQSLTDQAKKMLLSQWQKDLTQLLTATEENMPPQKGGTATPPPDTSNAELLQRVSNCLLRIDDAVKKQKV
jgi:hypothetical protein